MPHIGHQRHFGRCRAGCRLDQDNNLINVCQGNGQTFQKVGSFPGLAQIEQASACHDFPAVHNECCQHLLEIQQAGLTVYQRDHVDTENILQLGMLIKIVQDHLGHFTAAQLDDHAHTILVRFIAQFTDALETFFFHQGGDLLQQVGLVNLVRQFSDDDAQAIAGLIHLFHMGPGTDMDTAAAGAIGLMDTMDPIDDGGGGKIRTRQMLHQLTDADFRIGNLRQTGTDHLGEVVRGYIGCQPHRNTRRTIDQQVRNPGRHYCRLALRLVIVADEINCFLLQIGQHLMGDTRHANFGIAHGSRGIPVH